MIAEFIATLPATDAPLVDLHDGVHRSRGEHALVRFEVGDGSIWYGRLRCGAGYATRIVSWPEAKVVIVIAKGSVYWVCPRTRRWAYIDALGIHCVIDPAGATAMVTTYTDVVALTGAGGIRWRRTVAIDGVEIERMAGGIIHGLAELDPPGGWQPFALRLEDGADVG